MTGGNPRYGVHAGLEAQADAIIKASMAGVTSQSAKSDILTPWKEQDRRSREVYVVGGVPDAATRQGMYGRAWNRDMPHLNSVDGVRNRAGRVQASLDTTSMMNHFESHRLIGGRGTEPSGHIDGEL